jgi:hypothetical protein
MGNDIPWKHKKGVLFEHASQWKHKKGYFEGMSQKRGNYLTKMSLFSLIKGYFYGKQSLLSR